MNLKPLYLRKAEAARAASARAAYLSACLAACGDTAGADSADCRAARLSALAADYTRAAKLAH